MTFEECCAECLDNKEFVKQFNRLSGFHLGERRTGIEIAIDNACNHDPNKEAIPYFVDFVYNYIWLPLCREYYASDSEWQNLERMVAYNEM